MVWFIQTSSLKKIEDVDKRIPNNSGLVKKTESIRKSETKRLQRYETRYLVLMD